MAVVYAPSGYKPPADLGSVPLDSLELEHVHGYNGKNCRHNLKINANGHLVYTVAATGVVYDVASNSQKFFLGHNEDILCMAMHPDRKMVATGQLDPKGAETPFVCLWDSCDESVPLLAKLLSLVLE